MNAQNTNKFIIGLIINPVAGMGGSVGLKGTDGEEILSKAIELGAEPNAQKRSEEFLDALKPIKSKIKFIACPKYMGEYVLKKKDYKFDKIEDPIFDDFEELYDSSAEYTRKAAEIMVKKAPLRLIVFVGGDGTARDIFNVIDKKKPCLGIPAGVKIYSSVFSMNPSKAANLVMQFLWDEAPLKEEEVMDIDEEAFREGELVSKLYGYMVVPYNPEYCQMSKTCTPDSDQANQERIAKKIVQDLKDDVFYLIGPGTTTKAITDRLDEEKTVLGVDLLLNKETVAQDLNESQILDYIQDNPTMIIVSPIGNQGFIFGRGNLQFTPKVIQEVGKKNIIIISTKHKLNNIQGGILRVDTRNPETDEYLTGLYKVIIDFDEIRICRVE